MPQKYLAIDRILSKDTLVSNIKRFSKTLKDKIAQRTELTEEENTKIDAFEKDIVKDHVFHLVSVRTPFEEYTPIKFNLLFDYENLEHTEPCDLTVLHIIYLRNNYLCQLPLGHHCELIVEFKSHTPELLKKLPIDSHGPVKLGICNQEDWPSLKAEFIKARHNKPS